MVKIVRLRLVSALMRASSLATSTAFIFLLAQVNLPAQSAHESLRKGDEQFTKSKYSEAQDSYSRALKKSNTNDKAQYNLGNTYYRQGDYPNAVKMFDGAAQTAKTPAERADAYHNLGNAFLKQQKYQEAVKAYQNSLIQRPGDPETKVNLQLAKQKLQQQQQQQQNQQGQGGQQQQEQQQQEQQQQPPNQGDKDKEQQPQNQQPQEQPSYPKLEQSSEKFLEAIGRDDQRNKRKYQENTNNNKPSTRRKDW